MITPIVGGMNSYEHTEEGTRSLIKQMQGFASTENSGNMSFLTGSIEQNKVHLGSIHGNHHNIKANFNIAGGS